MSRAGVAYIQADNLGELHAPWVKPTRPPPSIHGPETHEVVLYYHRWAGQWIFTAEPYEDSTPVSFTVMGVRRKNYSLERNGSRSPRSDKYRVDGVFREPGIWFPRLRMKGRSEIYHLLQVKLTRVLAPMKVNQFNLSLLDLTG